MARQQINARIPEELFIAAHGRPESITDLVEDGLRWRLDMPKTRISGVHEMSPGLVDGPTRDEFDALRAEFDQLKRAAESQGAM